MNKKGYKILSHTADLRLEVYGKTLKELFINAAIALADILKADTQQALPPAVAPLEKIKIQAPNINALLVDLLNEILAKSHINKKVYKVYKIIKLKDNFVEAQIVGREVEEFDEDIKAVTYHETEIKENDGYKTKLIMDI